MVLQAPLGEIVELKSLLLDKIVYGAKINVDQSMMLGQIQNTFEFLNILPFEREEDVFQYLFQLLISNPSR
jgi:hypothetical protein